LKPSPWALRFSMNCSIVCSLSIIFLPNSCVFYTKSNKKKPPCVLNDLDNHRHSAPKAVQTRGTMGSPLDDPGRHLQHAQAQHFFSEVALIERAPQDDLVHPL